MISGKCYQWFVYILAVKIVEGIGEIRAQLVNV